MSAHRLAAAMLASVVAFASCSGGGDDETTSSSGTTDPCGPQACPFDYSGYDGTPAVSFDSDLFPVIRRSCNFSACHGKPVGSSAGLYLGPGLADMTTPIDMALKQQIIDGMVGQAAQTAAAMNRVVAGDPAQSFLMLKLDGCQSSAGLTCMSQGATMDPCGEQMPPGGMPLCADERDIFRRWIKQGAQNN